MDIIKIISKYFEMPLMTLISKPKLYFFFECAEITFLSRTYDLEMCFLKFFTVFLNFYSTPLLFRRLIIFFLHASKLWYFLNHHISSFWQDSSFPWNMFYHNYYCNIHKNETFSVILSFYLGKTVLAYQILKNFILYFV